MTCFWREIVGAADPDCAPIVTGSFYADPSQMAFASNPDYHDFPLRTYSDIGLTVEVPPSDFPVITHVAWYSVPGLNCAFVDWVEGVNSMAGVPWGDPSRLPNVVPGASGAPTISMDVSIPTYDDGLGNIAVPVTAIIAAIGIGATCGVGLLTASGANGTYQIAWGTGCGCW